MLSKPAVNEICFRCELRRGAVGQRGSRTVLPAAVYAKFVYLGFNTMKLTVIRQLLHLYQHHHTSSSLPSSWSQASSCRRSRDFCRLGFNPSRRVRRSENRKVTGRGGFHPNHVERASACSRAVLLNCRVIILHRA